MPTSQRGHQSISDLDKDAVAKLLSRAQNQAILDFIKDKGWVTAEEVATGLKTNATLCMLYMSDLEKVGLLERKEEEGGTFKFRLRLPDGVGLEEIVKAPGSGLSKEKVAEVVALYIRIYSSLIQKLNEVGGRATIENIIDGGKEGLGDGRALQVLSFLEKDCDAESCIVDFESRIMGGDFATGNFGEMKEDFIVALRKLLESLEKFMGKLYGQHLTKTSLKPVINEKRDIIIEFDLLAGLPREYFPLEGAKS